MNEELLIYQAYQMNVFTFKIKFLESSNRVLWTAKFELIGALINVNSMVCLLDD